MQLISQTSTVFLLKSGQIKLWFELGRHDIRKISIMVNVEMTISVLKYAYFYLSSLSDLWLYHSVCFCSLHVISVPL